MAHIRQPQYHANVANIGLTRGIVACVNAVTGRPLDVVNRRFLATPTGSPVFITAPHGRAIECNTDNDSVYYSDTAAGPKIAETDQASILWVGFFLTSADALAHIGGITFADANTDPYTMIEFRRNTNAGDNVALIYNSTGAAGGDKTLAGAVAYASGMVILIGRVRSGAQELYVNGALGAAATTAITALGHGTGPRLVIGDTFNATRNPQTACSLLAVWNRYLHKDEIAALSINPWQILEQRKRFSIRSTAAAVVSESNHRVPGGGWGGRVIAYPEVAT